MKSATQVSVNSKPKSFYSEAIKNEIIKIIEQLPKFSVVSLDIFDTALIRLVDKPIDIFLICDELASKRFALNPGFFKTMRQRAEYEIRQLQYAQYRAEEVTLEEIYERFRQLTRFPENVIVELQELELDSEFKILAPRLEILCLYRELQRLNMQTIFISDTYLPKPFILNVLQDKGFENPEVYLSSSHKMTKECGNLFGEVLNNLGISASQILHIGDNLHSDVRKALFYNLHTFFIPSVRTIKEKRLQNILITESVAASISNALTARRVSEQIGKDTTSGAFNPYEFGYSTLGTLWLGFCGWINQILEQEHIDHLYFLSRDGSILKQCYDKLYSKQANTSYLYVSRRALYIPFLAIDFEQGINNLLQNYSDQTLQDILQRSLPKDFDLAQCGFLHNQASILKQKIRNQADVELVKVIFQHLKDEVRKHAKYEFDNLICYLKKQGIDRHRRIGVVDLGWHGSLQHILKKVLLHANVRCNITGMYMATFAHAKQVEGKDCSYGFLANYGKPEPICTDIQNSPSLVEILHSANHGTVIGYSSEEEGGQPILHSHTLETTQYTSLISEMHRGALQHLEDYVQLCQELNLSTSAKISPLSASNNLRRLLVQPTNEEIKVLGSLQLAPDFGKNSRMLALIQNVTHQSTEPTLWKAGQEISATN